MKFTLSWLKEHLETGASLEQILEKLNAIGLEVEGVENPAEKLAPFRIARVLTAAPHPQADKLQVLSVDAGDGPLQVVCGAPNAREGLVGVFGMPGAYVPGSGITLKVTAIRGVESNGMMCSTRELELGEDHDGIIELPADAPVGEVYAQWAGLNDPVIEVAITPNRQDCMGVRGIARDLAAAGLGALKPLNVPSINGEGPAPDVRTDDPQGCPAFFARTVRGVKNGPSPEWLQKRLKEIGQKPISALVDITNYLMIDLGRPLHVYDMASLEGGLVARKAKAGEEVLALNGKTYRLDETMTVIADAEVVHDIGGIMGGEHSGAQESTTEVLIECAYFTPEAIARTGQKLALTSDARSRFERGIDPAFLDDGLSIATRMVMDLCGGTASDATYAGEPPLETRSIAFDPAAVLSLAGVVVSRDMQRAILEKLGFGIARHSGESRNLGLQGDSKATGDSGLRRSDDGSEIWTISVPSWRRDVEGSADIVEEVVRIHGIDKVPSIPLPRAPGVAKATTTPQQLMERRVRRAAAARGLNEAVNWSFISEKEAASVGGGDWTLANPISEEMKVMRPSLLPGLLSATQRNADRGASSIRLFEVGRRYFSGQNGESDERATVGIVLAGDKSPRNWMSGKASAFDAFDIKAEVIALLAATGAPVENLQMMGEASAAYHPGQSGTLRLGPKNVLAEYGVLHPAMVKQFDLSGSVVAAEIFLDAIPVRRRSGFMRAPYAPPSLQAVKRDFAFLVPEALEAEQLVRAARNADKKAIVDARLFDVFSGQGVPEGQKSLAIEVTLQPGEKSFTEEELSGISSAVVKAVAKLGGTLRG